MQAKRFTAGDLVYSPFSASNAVHIISRGYVFAFTHDQNGKRRIHVVYGPGHFFPVLSTFRGTQQRASYEALTDLEVSLCSRADFLQKIEQDHQYCQEILRRTVDQIDMFADHVVELQTANLEDRLYKRIKSLCINKTAKREVPYILKHHHLADMVGVERESISRSLARLKRKNKVTVTPEGRLQIIS